MGSRLRLPLSISHWHIPLHSCSSFQCPARSPPRPPNSPLAPPDAPRLSDPASTAPGSMAAKATPCKDALAKWAAAAGVEPAAADRVDLTGVCPPIEKMDSSLQALKACRHLALSTNALDKIGNLAGLEALETLSLGRNCLKNLSGLEAVGATLQQLWISYNQVDRLVSRAEGPCSVDAEQEMWLLLQSRAPQLTPAPDTAAGGRRKVRAPARAVRLQQPHQGLGRGGAPGGPGPAGGPAAGGQPAVQRVARRRRPGAVPSGGGCWAMGGSRVGGGGGVRAGLRCAKGRGAPAGRWVPRCSTSPLSSRPPLPAAGAQARAQPQEAGRAGGGGGGAGGGAEEVACLPLLQARSPCCCCLRLLCDRAGLKPEVLHGMQGSGGSNRWQQGAHRGGGARRRRAPGDRSREGGRGEQES